MKNQNAHNPQSSHFQLTNSLQHELLMLLHDFSDLY